MYFYRCEQNAPAAQIKTITYNRLWNYPYNAEYKILSENDGLATALILYPVLKIKTHKMVKNFKQPSEDTQIMLKKIIDEFIETENYSQTIEALLAAANLFCNFEEDAKNNSSKMQNLKNLVSVNIY